MADGPPAAVSAAPAPPLVADLIELGRAYRRAALAGRHLYNLMFGRPVPTFSPHAEGRAVADAAYQPLVEAVRRCQRAGSLAGREPDRVALHLWAVVHGMVSLEIDNHLPAGPAPDSQVFDQALRYAGAPFLSAGPGPGRRARSDRPSLPAWSR